MKTHKNAVRKPKRIKKTKRTRRSKNKRGGGVGCSSSVHCTTEQNFIVYGKVYDDLLDALDKKKPQKVERLLLKYKDIAHRFDQSALDEASMMGHTEIVEMLLNDGARLAPGKGGFVLMISSQNGYIEIVEMLLNKEAVNVNATEHYFGDTALHRASLSGRKDVVEMLLEKGADVNAMNKGGFTALHMASLMGHEDIVAILLEKGLEKGADVNAENKSGDTALILASKNGHPKIVKLINEYPKNQSEADKKNWDIVQKELREREGEDISPGKIVLGMTSEQGPSPRDFLGGKKNKKKTKKQRR